MRITDLLYLFEGYKEAQTDFSKTADPETVKATIDQFKELVNRNRVSGAERNIDYWRKQGWEAFAGAVKRYVAAPSKREVKTRARVGQSANLIENDNWLVVLPMDKDASCFYGKDTAWCTTKANLEYFESYFYNKEITLIYCLNKKTGGKWAIAAHTKVSEIECFDQQDNSIKPDVFEQETGLNPHDLVTEAHEKYGDRANDARVEYTSRMKKIYDYFYDGTYADEIEDLLSFTKDSSACARYIDQEGYRDYPEAIVYAAVSADPELVKNVKNVSVAMAKTMVRVAPGVYRHIQGQFGDKELVSIQKALVDRDGSNIKMIQNPSEEVQLRAVTRNYEAIAAIANPTMAVQMAAVKASGGNPEVYYMIPYPARRPEIYWQFNKQTLVSFLKRVIDATKKKDLDALNGLRQAETNVDLEVFINKVGDFRDIDPRVKQFADRAYDILLSMHRVLKQGSTPWRPERQDQALMVWDSEHVSDLQQAAIADVKEGTMTAAGTRVYVRILSKSLEKFQAAVAEHGVPEHQTDYQRRIRSVMSTIKLLQNYGKQLQAQTADE
jgi:predicted DNA binding CopG/RHH family protein